MAIEDVLTPRLSGLQSEQRISTESLLQRKERYHDLGSDSKTYLLHSTLDLLTHGVCIPKQATIARMLHMMIVKLMNSHQFFHKNLA